MFGFWSSRRIYMDHAATTLLDGRVLRVMKRVLTQNYFNPGALYREGVTTDQLIEQSRRSVAKILGTTSDHVIFTRGGTESCNMALLGVLGNLSTETVPHVITSVIEHAAVLETLKALEQAGKVELSLIPVTSEGIVIVDEIKKALKPTTVLVSVMYVNNEIGTIQPIKEIVKLVRWYKKQHNLLTYPLVHTDAIQAVNYLDIHTERLGVDLMSLSGSKIYGPKSSGVLYVRDRKYVRSMFFGGDQEFGLRAGTEDVAQVVGFAQALEITRTNYEQEKQRLELLRDEFIAQLVKNIPEIVINGSLVERNANNINVTIPGISGERLVIELDAQGIAAASKSACKEDDGEASHVIAALRKESGHISVTDGAVRFTMGRNTTSHEVVKTVAILKEIVERIRSFEQTLKK